MGFNAYQSIQEILQSFSYQFLLNEIIEKRRNVIRYGVFLFFNKIFKNRSLIN